MAQFGSSGKFQAPVFDFLHELQKYSFASSVCKIRSYSACNSSNFSYSRESWNIGLGGRLVVPLSEFVNFAFFVTSLCRFPT